MASTEDMGEHDITMLRAMPTLLARRLPQSREGGGPPPSESKPPSAVSTPSLDAQGGMMPVPALLWNACDGMMVIDEHRHILAMNPALERLTGHRRQEVVGDVECGALFACQDHHGCFLADHSEGCPGLRAIRRFRPVKGAEYSIQTATGRRIWMSASYTPIQPDPAGPIWTLVVMRDVRLQKRREHQMARQASTDPLTGLLNRAWFFEACDVELKRATRHSQPLAIAMGDLDGFKAYNDTYGHLEGDRLLKDLAGVMRTSLRATERVARYGGDEFVILLPETDAAGAMALAERLRQVIAQFPFVRPDASAARTFRQPMTISLGVAVFPGDGTTAEALLAQADRRMFEAKQQGYNRVVAAVQVGERRRQRRIELNVPIAVCSPDEEPPGAWHTGVAKDISLRGAYFTIPPWKAIAMDEVMRFSITIPSELQRAFPFSRLMGRGRVVRVEGMARMSEPGWKRLGLAVAFFGEGFTALAGIGSRS